MVLYFFLFVTEKEVEVLQSLTSGDG